MKDLAYYMSLPYEIKVKKLSKEEGGGFGAQNYAITMKTNIMEQMDKEASRLGISRSALIAVGMQDYIKRNSI